MQHSPPFQEFAIQSLESRRLLAVAIDLNFGVNGRVSSELRTDGGYGYDYFADALLQSDGKLLVLADNDTDSFLIRYNDDGARDQSFAPHGMILLPKKDRTYFTRLHPLPNGQMLLTGTTGIFQASQYGQRVLLARLNADGSVDSSFGTGGLATAATGISDGFPEIFASAILPDGKILASGRVTNAGPGFNHAGIWRFNSDGSIDNTFGINGLVRYDYGESRATIGLLLPNPDGSFFGSTTIGEAKFNADGSIDASFGNNGYLPRGSAFQTRQLDGKFLGFGRISTGSGTTDAVVYRWLSDGGPDTSFGAGGARQIHFGEQDFPRSLSLDASGRIILGATTSNGVTNPYAGFSLARLLPDGSLDSTFGFNGIYIDSFVRPDDPPIAGGELRQTLVAPDGKVIAVGTSILRSTEDPTLLSGGDNIAITRYVPDAPITILAGPFGPVFEGENFTVRDSGSNYANGEIISYEWDYGSSGYIFIPEAQGRIAQLRADDDPSAPIALRVTTSDGLSAIGVAQVSVVNVPPTLDAGPDRVAAAGIPIRLRFEADDAVTEAAEVTVNWGDGTTDSVFSFFNNDHPEMLHTLHTYSIKGLYTVVITIDDGDGGVSTDTMQVHVGDIIANVFEDPDGNGVQELDVELGASGRTVWIDLNDNGTQDDGEPSGISDTFGEVLFDGLVEDAYHLRTQVPPGWQVTFADGSLRDDSCDATIGDALEAICHFGLTQRAMVTGTIFNDLNGNGVRDATEPHLGGAGVIAYDLSGNHVSSSGGSYYSDGFYRVRGLPPGTYLLDVSSPGPSFEWMQTFPAARSSYIVTVSAGETLDNINFGLREARGATARGLVFEDRDADGVYGLGDRPAVDPNFAGPVYIDMDNDGVRNPNERLIGLSLDGTWSIPQLPAATYTFRLMTKPGWVQTFPADNSGITVELAGTATISNLDFGAHKTDLVPPQVTTFTVRRDLKPNVFEITFSEAMALSSTSLVVNALNISNVYVQLTSFDPTTNKAVFTPTDMAVLPDANYRAFLNSDIAKDLAGNSLSGTREWSFFILTGDLNGDRSVSIADFIALASNFGKINATYADGDINYDGQVTIADFIDLAANFNKTLAPPPEPAQAPAAEEITELEDTTGLAAVAKESDRSILKRSQPRLDLGRTARHPQIHHRRHQRKPAPKWRSRTGAY